MAANSNTVTTHRSNKSKRVSADESGTALLEFAITLPVLLILYLGCVQICDAVSVYRKTTTTTRTIADLTSQYAKVTNEDLDAIMGASSQIMAPYATAGLRMILTQVTVSATGVATVDWSRGSGVAGDVVGSTYTLPTGVGVNGTSLVIGKVNYDYVANMGGIVRTDIPLGDTIYMYPRSTTKIPKI